MDENRFVFMDRVANVYLVQPMSDGILWLCRWNSNTKKFTTIRQLSHNEANSYPRNLTDFEQNLYLREAGLTLIREAGDTHG